MSLCRHLQLWLVFLVLAAGCSREPSGYSERHLGAFGLDLTLLVPDSAQVQVKEYGPIRDFTVSDGGRF
jgi:hypothetical protein